MTFQMRLIGADGETLDEAAAELVPQSLGIWAAPSWITPVKVPRYGEWRAVSAGNDRDKIDRKKLRIEDLPGEGTHAQTPYE